MSRWQGSPTGKPRAMGPYRLSCLGILWVALSFISMGLACVGVYFPYWLKGSLPNSSPTHVGLFRRCHYPRLGEAGEVEFVMECGRYRSFDDIPSVWWQTGTVTGGVGGVLLLLVFILELFSCCVRDFLSHPVAKVAGILQFVAGLCIGTACLLYPLGWESLEVRQVCGPSADIYYIGACTIGWAYYAAMGGAVAAFLGSLLSCHAIQQEMPAAYRTGYRL